jgi:Sec-independent protein secretion pathway component TatC
VVAATIAIQVQEGVHPATQVQVTLFQGSGKVGVEFSVHTEHKGVLKSSSVLKYFQLAFPHTQAVGVCHELNIISHNLLVVRYTLSSELKYLFPRTIVQSFLILNWLSPFQNLNSSVLLSAYIHHFLLFSFSP